eukprot:301051-Rhodomonas_salina.2
MLLRGLTRLCRMLPESHPVTATTATHSSASPFTHHPLFWQDIFSVLRKIVPLFPHPETLHCKRKAPGASIMMSGGGQRANGMESRCT